MITLVFVLWHPFLWTPLRPKLSSLYLHVLSQAHHQVCIVRAHQILARLILPRGLPPSGGQPGLTIPGVRAPMTGPQMYTCTSLSLSLCIYIYIYICMYVYIYIYIYISPYRVPPWGGASLGAAPGHGAARVHPEDAPQPLAGPRAESQPSPGVHRISEQDPVPLQEDREGLDWSWLDWIKQMHVHRNLSYQDVRYSKIL